MDRLKFLFCSILFLFFTISLLFGNSRIHDKITEAVKGFRGKIGIAVIVDGKDTVTYNNSGHFPMMSVFKFHQALAVADFLQKKGIAMDTVIHIGKAELKDETYSPLRDKYPDGNLDMSVSDLLAYTLRFSDNNACDILFNHIVGVEDTDSYIRSLGIDEFAIGADENAMHEDMGNSEKNWSTPLASAELLELFVTRRTVTGEYYDFIRKTMVECSTGESRLPLPLKGRKATIGHKTGTGFTNEKGELTGINDIGFVELENGCRYVITVFVTDSRESYADTERVIANVSAAVLDSIVNEE